MLMISHAADASERELGGYRPGPGFYNTSASSYGKGDPGHSLMSLSSLHFSTTFPLLPFFLPFFLSSFLPFFISCIIFYLPHISFNLNLTSELSHENINRRVSVILPGSVYSPLICLPQKPYTTPLPELPVCPVKFTSSLHGYFVCGYIRIEGSRGRYVSVCVFVCVCVCMCL